MKRKKKASLIIKTCYVLASVSFLVIVGATGEYAYKDMTAGEYIVVSIALALVMFLAIGLAERIREHVFGR